MVVPVLVALLNRVLAALERIRAPSDDILAGGVALIGELDGCPSCWPVTDETIEDVSRPAPSATPAPSASCWAERRRSHMPAVAW